MYTEHTDDNRDGPNWPTDSDGLPGAGLLWIAARDRFASSMFLSLGTALHRIRLQDLSCCSRVKTPSSLTYTDH